MARKTDADQAGDIEICDNELLRIELVSQLVVLSTSLQMLVYIYHIWGRHSCLLQKRVVLTPQTALGRNRGQRNSGTGIPHFQCQDRPSHNGLFDL